MVRVPALGQEARAIACHLDLDRYRTRQLIREPWKLQFEMWKNAIEYRKDVQYRR